MAGERTVKIKIIGENKDANRAFGETEKSAGGLGTALGDVGKIASGFVVGNVLTQLPGLLSGAASSAVELEQNAKKSGIVFGDQIGTVQDWAAENAAAMGLTKNEAVTLATSMGDLLIPMGFTREEAAKMSTETNNLAGALSEWSGGTKSSAEVSEILTKAMLGERDGLKALGISISEAEVKQQLLKNGTSELTGEALAQATAIATQELIMAKSTDAQTAYAEGADSTARKQALATAAMAESKELLSSALLPAVTLGTTLFAGMATVLAEKIIPALSEGASAIGSFAGPIVTLVGQYIEPLIAGLTAIGIVILASFIPAMVAWAAAMLPVIAQHIALAAATVIAYAPIILALVAVGVAVALLYAAWDSNLFGIQDVVKRLWDYISPIIGTVVSTLTSLWESTLPMLVSGWEAMRDGVMAVVSFIKDSIVVPVFGAIAGFLGEHKEQIFGILDTAWSLIKGTVENAINLVKGIIETVMALIKGDWEGVWNGIKDIAQTVWDQIQLLVDTAINLVKDLFPIFRDALFLLWDATWLGVKTLFETAWGLVVTAVETGISAVKQFFVDLPGNITSALGDLTTLLVSKGEDILKGLNAGIQTIWTTLKDWFGSLADSDGPVLSAFGDLTKLLVGKGEELLSSFVAGIQIIWTTLKDWFGSLVDLDGPILSAIGSLDVLLIGKGEDILKGLNAGIQKKWSDLKDWLGTLIDPDGPILSAVGDLSGLLTGVGKDILDGLGDSIRDNAADIVGSAIDFVSDKIPGWAKSALGISSPSKVMMPIGRNIVEGMAVGALGAIPSLSKAMDAVNHSLIQNPNLARPLTTMALPMNRQAGPSNGNSAGSMGASLRPQSAAPMHVHLEIGGREVQQLIVDTVNGHARRSY